MGLSLVMNPLLSAALRLAVHARDEIVFLEGIVDETIRRLQLGYGDLGIERAGDHQGHDPDNPGRWMAHDTCQKGHHGGGSVHKIDGC